MHHVYSICIYGEFRTVLPCILYWLICWLHCLRVSRKIAGDNRAHVSELQASTALPSLQ